MSTIVLTASTGRVGLPLCAALDAAGSPWIGLTRSPDRAHAAAAAAGFVPTSGHWALADPSDAAAVARSCAPGGALWLASADHPQQDLIESSILEACRDSGVAHVVKLSAQSAGLTPPASFGRLHARVEHRLRASGIGWTVLRPVFFMQSLLFFAAPVRRGLLPAATGRGRVAFVDAQDVAAAAAAVLRAPAAHVGRTYTLTGPSSAGFCDVAQGLGKRLGRSIRHASPPGWVARIALPLATGMPRWQAGLVVELLQAIARGAQAEVTPDLGTLIGRPPTTLDAFLDAHAGAFR